MYICLCEQQAATHRVEANAVSFFTCNNNSNVHNISTGTRCVIITGTPVISGAQFSQYAVYLHKKFRAKAIDLREVLPELSTICTAFTV